MHAGMEIGNYRVIEQIAASRTGETYLARMLNIAGFSKQVALKRAPDASVHDPEWIASFVKEAHKWKNPWRV